MMNASSAHDVEGAQRVKPTVPSTFYTREAFTTLEAEGLARLPDRPGFMLAYHASSTQWHARLADEHVQSDGQRNYAPTWGGLRSERKALLLALCQLWTWYLERFQDAEGAAHLQRIQTAMDEITF